MHEAQLHEVNSFATLTYAAEALPGPSLVYRDFQLFMKRLRRARSAPVRFYMCGEYGERYQRPHFHVCLFNCGFSDRRHLRGRGRMEEFVSAELDSIWGKGACVLGQVTFESAAYVARYMIVDTQRFHIDDDGVFTELTREFNHMSLRPAVGAEWFRRFGVSDVSGDGRVVVRGKKSKAPRYYDKLIKRGDAEAFARIQGERVARALEQAAGERTYRLAVKEAVARAGLALKRRS